MGITTFPFGNWTNLVARLLKRRLLQGRENGTTFKKSLCKFCAKLHLQSCGDWQQKAVVGKTFLWQCTWTLLVQPPQRRFLQTQLHHWMITNFPTQRCCAHTRFVVGLRLLFAVKTIGTFCKKNFNINPKATKFPSNGFLRTNSLLLDCIACLYFQPTHVLLHSVQNIQKRF